MEHDDPHRKPTFVPARLAILAKHGLQPPTNQQEAWNVWAFLCNTEDTSKRTADSIYAWCKEHGKPEAMIDIQSAAPDLVLDFTFNQRPDDQEPWPIPGLRVDASIELSDKTLHELAKELPRLTCRELTLIVRAKTARNRVAALIAACPQAQHADHVVIEIRVANDEPQQGAEDYYQKIFAAVGHGHFTGLIVTLPDCGLTPHNMETFRQLITGGKLTEVGIMSATDDDTEPFVQCVLGAPHVTRLRLLVRDQLGKERRIRRKEMLAPLLVKIFTKEGMTRIVIHHGAAYDAEVRNACLWFMHSAALQRVEHLPYLKSESPGYFLERAFIDRNSDKRGARTLRLQAGCMSLARIIFERNGQAAKDVAERLGWQIVRVTTEPEQLVLQLTAKTVHEEAKAAQPPFGKVVLRAMFKWLMDRQVDLGLPLIVALGRLRHALTERLGPHQLPLDAQAHREVVQTLGSTLFELILGIDDAKVTERILDSLRQPQAAGGPATPVSVTKAWLCELVPGDAEDDGTHAALGAREGVAVLFGDIAQAIWLMLEDIPRDLYGEIPWNDICTVTSWPMLLALYQQVMELPELACAPPPVPKRPH